MRAHVLLHVREHPAGPVVVTPVVFADLAFAAESFEAAVAALTPTLAARLASLEPVDRLPHLASPGASLLRVLVDVPGVDKTAEALEISLGIVIVDREAHGKPVSVAYCPIVPGFDLLQKRPNHEELARTAAERVARRMKSWTVEAVLAADEPADSRLETLELELAGGGSEEADEFGPAASLGGILEELGVDLAQRGRGRIDGRDEVVGRVLETLAAADRSSVLLVGPPDVGKTALVQEVARRIGEKEVPAPLIERRIWRLSANELIAGAQYTGQWQDRTRRLVEQARTTKAIVVMGDPIGIIDAGRWSQSDNNVSRFLRPYVESGEITLICECTPEQLSAAQLKERSFVDAFHRIDVLEPTLAVTLGIASAAAARLAQNSGIEIAPDAVTAAVELTRRFEPYRSFPGKTVRLLEDTARDREERETRLDRESVTRAFARRTGLPLALLSDAIPLDVDAVRRHFESRVLGQPEATAAMVDAVMMLKAGLNAPGKPLASFFFVGPTGVGKTELAKALAEFLFSSRDRVIRLDMGEYASTDAVQRLLGTTWGNEGELTEQVRRQPFCVVLLDEIEKAHWSIFDALLAALGEGRLTDASGRSADFRNAIIIMTSNLGATRASSASLGFGSSGDATNTIERRYVEAAEKFFRPEFFNRIDRIAVFHALGAETVRRIARRELSLLLEREGIVRRGLRIEVDEAVVDSIARKGLHPRYGARPLQREIERTVIQPLARLLVRRSLAGGDFLRVHLAAGAVTVTVERVTEEARAEGRRARRLGVEDAQFARAARSAVAFEDELANDDASGYAEEVRPVVSDLIERTHDQRFWDDADSARSTLQRIYQLEQVVDRFDSLRERATGLVAMARRVQEARDRSRVREIAEAIDEMRDRLLVLRLELAAAAVGAEGGGATISVVPVGRDSSEWAEQLRGMYEAWADRTGRGVLTSENGSGEIVVDGLATFELLTGEAGLHRHVRPERTESLARVTVRGSDGRSAAGTQEPGVVVRVYEEGKRRIVRDPRTDARESHVRSVLAEGQIDLFLIAWLRANASREQPSAPGPG